MIAYLVTLNLPPQLQQKQNRKIEAQLSMVGLNEALISNEDGRGEPSHQRIIKCVPGQRYIKSKYNKRA